MVVDLMGWLYFFVRIAIALIVSLAISRTVLIEKKIAIGFSGLFLW